MSAQTSLLSPECQNNVTGPLGLGPDGQVLELGFGGGWTMKGRCAEADSSDPLLVTENENPPIIHITAPGWWIPEPQQGLLQEDGLCLWQQA